jgi:hypothetical protein
MTSRRKGLREAESLERILARRGAELLLHGHVHRNCAIRGPGDLHVFGTASASSTDPGAPAAYRCFDIDAGGDEWQVRMRLVTMAADGAIGEAAEAWRVPLRPGPSAASIAR